MNRAILLAACALLAAPACGKKGPPLAPIVRVPAAVDQISARRVGDDVYVSVTVPVRNVDATTPADVEQILVYGFTGRAAPPRPRWAELGTLVATIPVQPPAGSDDAPGANADGSSPAIGPAQGTSVTIRDTLSADELVPAVVAAAPLPPNTTAPATGGVRRFFTAFAIGPRGRPSPPGATADVPISGLPSAPTGLRVTYTERATTVAWNPVPAPPPEPAVTRDDIPTLPGTASTIPVAPPEVILPPEAAVGPTPGGAGVGPVVPAQPGVPGVPGVQPPATQAPSAGQTVPAASARPRYNVYREVSPVAGSVATVATAWNASAPTPANAEAIDATTFVDDVEFGRERCYTVRTVQGSGAAAIESAPSSRVCVVPADTFPPQSPSAPATVAADGVITLVWEPNAEPDLGGYLVLRGEAGDDTLRPLTPAPIAEARYRDADVVPGRRYVYAVIAVDARTPVANASAASARVEETAR